jgi:hypothetical protein
VALLALGAAGVATQDGRDSLLVRYTFVDLQPKANHKLDDSLGDLEHNHLAAVPRGVRKFGGAPFRVGEGLIRVRGGESPGPPSAVEGIAVNARFDALHVLHSTMFGSGFGVDDGTEIGAYVVRYADRTTARIPIVYGVDVRDWWEDSDPALPSRGRLAWSGTNPAAGDGAIRLFSTEWANPHPDKKVASIDFETKDTACAPFLVALTLEEQL